MEATDRPANTLKRLQSSGTEGVPGNTSRALDSTGRYRSATQKGTMFKKIHVTAFLEFAKRHDTRHSCS